MKKSFYFTYLLFGASALTSCYSNSLVQSASVLKPKQTAITAAFETSKKNSEYQVYDLPNFGLRVGVVEGLELQAKSNLASFVELGGKFKIIDDSHPYQIAMGLNFGLVRVPYEFQNVENTTTDLLINEKVIFAPIYISKKINQFTIFGGTKLGYAVESNDMLATGNLGLAYKLPNTKHTLFFEVYNVQSPKSLNANYNQINRYGLSIGVSLNAF